MDYKATIKDALSRGSAIACDHSRDCGDRSGFFAYIAGALLRTVETGSSLVASAFASRISAILTARKLRCTMPPSLRPLVTEKTRAERFRPVTLHNTPTPSRMYNAI